MRKYFMELFVMGFVDSVGNLIEENILRDAQKTAALTAKIMGENMNGTRELELFMNKLLCAWLICSDESFSRCVTCLVGEDAASVEEHLWTVGSVLEDDEYSDYISEYLLALIVEVANMTRDQMIENFMRFMSGGLGDGEDGM